MNKQYIETKSVNVEDMDKENESEDNKLIFLANKIGISDEQFLQCLEQRNQTDILDKTDRNRKRLDKILKTQTN